MPPKRKSRVNGSLLERRYYDSNNTLLKKVKNTYQYPNASNWFWGYKSALKNKLLSDPIHDGYSFCTDYNIGVYPIEVMNSAKIVQTRESFYFNNGNDSIVKQIEYQYDAKSQVVSLSTTTSEGTVESIILTYPYNHSIESVYSSMIQDNYISYASPHP